MTEDDNINYYHYRYVKLCFRDYQYKTLVDVK